jgi:nucleoside-diphosphate-sugar epimerase
MTRRTVKLVREGKYAAEVPIDLIEDGTGWSPYLSIEDAIDAVRIALRNGDVAGAARHGRVFELLPVSG